MIMDNNAQQEEGGTDMAIHTFNVRGCRDKNKRARLFNHFRNQMKGIICLQEIYSMPGDEQIWEREWGGSVYLAHGSQHSRGVATLIPKYYEHSVQEIKIDPNGRYILINGIFQGTPLVIMNVYAPTNDKQKEQNEFLDNIMPAIHENFHKTIIAGDLNTTLTKIDKYRQHIRTSKYADKLNNMIDELDMCDIFRVLHPETQRFTWRKAYHGKIMQSRLDYILIPNSLIYKIQSCNIGASLYSDHSPVSLKIKGILDNKPGRGFWKFNVSLLKDSVYVNEINALIDLQIQKYHAHNQKALIWDTVKMEIRSHTLSYSAYKAKMKREYQTSLKNELEEVEDLLTNNQDLDHSQRRTTIIKELENINNEITRGHQIRAKAEHIEFNEQNSAYFFNKEKARGQTKNIQCIKLDGGKEITKTANIMACQKEYYENLYTEKQTLNENDQQAFLNDDTIPCISEEDKQNLNNPITKQELANAIKELPNGKSPGTDGIPIEFYKTFWIKISTLVYNSIQYAIDNDAMSNDQKRGILSLIPKKDKDIRYLKNWRPLTLLNSDYKIFAKLMALRLQTVLDTLISTDQSGCIKGRSTFSNIRSTIDVITYVNEKNLPGILTYIDFEKAFDTVNWNFMHKCLKTMNFGDYFKKCIKIMYTDIKSCVVNYGHVSPFFEPSRGIRQGCPLSAYLFIIIVEILAHAIRKDPNIRGIIVNGLEFKISQYADDTCLFLQNENSLQTALRIFDNFYKCSGLKVNMEKSEAIWIGASSNFRHKPLGLKWTRGAICLGVYISNNLKEMINKNYSERLNKVENILKLWTLRKLTLKGKVLVTNTLIIPQLIYLISVIHMPRTYIDRFKKLITDFIWDYKPAKIKYATMINKIESGGLKLQDIETKIKSMKLKWIKQILDPDYISPWKTYLDSKFTQNITDIPVYNMNSNDYPTFTDPFYTDLFDTWAKIHANEPQNAEQVCKQIIWKNMYVQINGKAVHYHNWERHNITFMQDLIDQNGTIMSKQDLSNKYHFVPKAMEYESLRSALPTKWKKMLIANKSLNKNYLVFKECIIKIEDKFCNIEGVTTRELYWHLLSTICKRPTSESKWNEKLNFEIDENMFNLIYVNEHGLTTDTRINNLQFKITHRILPCNYFLQIWKIKNSNLCTWCNDIDTIEHYIVKCKDTHNLWKTILNWWASNNETWFHVDTYEILFGIPNERNETIINQLNYIILIAKYYIYIQKQKNMLLDLYEFLLECKNRLNIKEEIMSAAGKLETFQEQWGRLSESL